MLPLTLWGIALLIDLAMDPWGTWIIGSAHAVLAVVAAGSVVRDVWRIRFLKRGS